MKEIVINKPYEAFEPEILSKNRKYCSRRCAIEVSKQMKIFYGNQYKRGKIDG